MLTFFRRIRKGLLGEGATSKYLIYAIGEIALVVIGILIALQINNWNEFARDRKLERSTLIEIQKSLVADIKVLQDQVDLQYTVWTGIKELLTQMEKNLSYSESMDPLFPNALNMNKLTLNRSAFDLLQQRGADLIMNDKLRNAIVTYFNYDQQDLLKRNEVWLEIQNRFAFYYEDLLEADISDDFTLNYQLGNERLTPIDYVKFRSDENLKAELKYRIHRITKEIALIERFIQKQEQLLDAVKKEIE